MDGILEITLDNIDSIRQEDLLGPMSVRDLQGFKKAMMFSEIDRNHWGKFVELPEGSEIVKIFPHYNGKKDIVEISLTYINHNKNTFCGGDWEVSFVEALENPDTAKAVRTRTSEDMPYPLTKDYIISRLKFVQRYDSRNFMFERMIEFMYDFILPTAVKYYSYEDRKAMWEESGLYGEGDNHPDYYYVNLAWNGMFPEDCK